MYATAKQAKPKNVFALYSDDSESDSEVAAATQLKQGKKKKKKKSKSKGSNVLQDLAMTTTKGKKKIKKQNNKPSQRIEVNEEQPQKEPNSSNALSTEKTGPATPESTTAKLEPHDLPSQNMADHSVSDSVLPELESMKNLSMFEHWVGAHAKDRDPSTNLWVPGTDPPSLSPTLLTNNSQLERQLQSRVMLLESHNAELLKSNTNYMMELSGAKHQLANQHERLVQLSQELECHRQLNHQYQQYHHQLQAQARSVTTMPKYTPPPQRGQAQVDFMKNKYNPPVVQAPPGLPK